MGKLPANAGAERTAVSGLDNRSGQQPGAHITQHEFVRTCYPDEMSRKQRRMCRAKIGKPGQPKERKKKPWLTSATSAGPLPRPAPSPPSRTPPSGPARMGAR